MPPTRRRRDCGEVRGISHGDRILLPSGTALPVGEICSAKLDRMPVPHRLMTLRCPPRHWPTARRFYNAPVAQPDRVVASEAIGRGSNPSGRAIFPCVACTPPARAGRCHVLHQHCAHDATGSAEAGRGCCDSRPGHLVHRRERRSHIAWEPAAHRIPRLFRRRQSVRIGAAGGQAWISPDAVRWLRVIEVPLVYLLGPLLYGHACAADTRAGRCNTLAARASAAGWPRVRHFPVERTRAFRGLTAGRCAVPAQFPRLAAAGCSLPAGRAVALAACAARPPEPPSNAADCAGWRS